MADQVSDLRLFAQLVAAGSLSAAARALQSSPPVMSRRLAELEARLGVRLIQRTSRRFDLTEEGSQFHERCLKILAEIDEAEAEAAARGTSAHGLLRIGAPSEFGRRWLAPLLPRFSRAHAQVKLHLALTDAGVDLIESGLDLVLRMGRPPESEVISTRLITSRRIVCAAPAYLARHGRPQVPEDLLDHDCIRLVRGRRVFDEWVFRDPTGPGPRTLRVAGTLSTSSGEILHDWALAGAGIALKALWDIREDLAAGRLVECLADHWCDAIELHAVYQSRRHLAPRLRLFLDFLRAELAYLQSSG